MPKRLKENQRCPIVFSVVLNFLYGSLCPVFLHKSRNNLILMRSIPFIFIFFIASSAFSQTFNLKESIQRGKELYTLECQSCHMSEGEGISGVYPPVAKTDYLKQPTPFLINIILKGQSGEIIVNGATYNTPMPAQDYLTDEKVSDILNYIRNSWTNKGAAITPAQVKTQREKNKTE